MSQTKSYECHYYGQVESLIELLAQLLEQALHTASPGGMGSNSCPPCEMYDSARNVKL